MITDTSVGGLTAALVLGALTFKGIDLVKYILVFISRATATSEDGEKARSEALNGLLTLALGGIIGIVIVLSVANAGFADGIKVGEDSLGGLDMSSKLALGLAMTSLAGVLFDGKKALDNSDTASKPKLLPKAEKDRQAFVKDALSA